MERAARIFAWTVFPSVLGGSVVFAIFWMDAGGDPGQAFLLPTVAAALLILGFERVFPHQRDWQRPRGDVKVDLAHLVSVSLTGALVSPLVYLAALPVAASLSESAGLPLWPAGWPWALQLVLALVVAELPKYWFHRLEHEHDFLWRFHATHHSAPRLYWLNAARFHPVDIAVDTSLGLAVLVVLGCGAEVLALFALVSSVHGYFQHANLRLRLGPLNYFFSMAELHRWHHSRTMAEANHNYGQNLIVWDLVFGSFFLPAHREPPADIGIPDLDAFPMTFWAQLASPLRWRRIRRESAAGRQVLPAPAR